MQYTSIEYNRILLGKDLSVQGRFREREGVAHNQICQDGVYHDAGTGVVLEDTLGHITHWQARLRRVRHFGLLFTQRGPFQEESGCRIAMYERQ